MARFINEEKNEDVKEILNDIEKEENRQDQLGIEETKQPEEEKPTPKPVFAKEEWNDATVGTLVNLRKQPTKAAEVLATVKGGEIIKVSSSFSHPQFEKAQYKGKEGYIVKQYVRKI